MNNAFSDILENDKVLLEFSSKSCLPCKALARKITEWKKEHPDIVFRCISIDDHPEIASNFGIYSVPAVVYYVKSKKMIEKAGYFSLEEVFVQIERIEEILKQER